MNKREARRITDQENNLVELGFTRSEAESLRRISMALHSWCERECGTENGCIERDDETGRPSWIWFDHAGNRHSHAIRDMKNGALRRLARILEGKPFGHYYQTDPRGASLYLIPKDKMGENVESCYSSIGICIY